MPRAKKAPAKGVGVAILASIYSHHHDSGKQFTVQDGADAIGVAWPTLDAWISGKSVPRLDQARRLAQFMGISLDELAALYFDRKADIVGVRQSERAAAKASPPVFDEEENRTQVRILLLTGARIGGLETE